MRPTVQELCSIWLYAYSRSSFLEAETWIVAMQHVPTESPLMRSLTCSAVVSNARPFTKSQITSDKRVVPLQGILAPPNLTSTHEMILKLRDKVIGHKDAIPGKKDSSTPNIILIKRDASGFDLNTVEVKAMAPEVQAQVKSLCCFFVKHCESHLKPLMDRFTPEVVQHPIGLYELLVSEPPSPWIREITQPS